MEKRRSIFVELWARRVPQFFGGYCLTLMGVVQFVGWLEDRFLFSPDLTNFVFIFFLSFIPSVLLISYYHGKPGDQSFTTAEKIGIPANLVVACLLLFVLFGDKNLGKTAKTITVRDEEGRSIEKVVPKNEYRKKVAFFFFENRSGSPEEDWLQYALPEMVAYDLSQDLFLDLATVSSLVDKIKQTGVEPLENLPFSLQKKIAGDTHKDYFVNGHFSREGEAYLIQATLFVTKTGKRKEQRTFRGGDLLTLVDEMATRFKQDLDIPEGHLAESEDLPAADLFTPSMAALKQFYQGAYRITLANDYPGGVALYEQAVAEDPDFALAYFYLFVAYQLANQTEKGTAVLPKLMDLQYKLPERQKFVVKTNYYQLQKQDPEKALAVVKMWSELYPQDLTAREVLATLYVYRNEIEAAIAECRKILELDPQQVRYHQEIGKLHQQLGQFEEARAAFQAYVDRFPEEPRSYIPIGDLYTAQGKFEQAKQQYEKALLLEPGRVEFLTKLANVHTQLADFQQAVDHYQEALDHAKTPKDRARVYEALAGLHLMRGQLQQTLHYSDRRHQELEQFLPPLFVIATKLVNLNLYVLAGKEAQAFEQLQALSSQLGPQTENISFQGALQIYLALEDPERARKAAEKLENFIDAMKLDILRPRLLSAYGRIHELTDDYQKAIDFYQQQAALQPTNAEIQRDIGRCYRQWGKTKEAEKALRSALAITPSDPKALYEYALVQEALGSTERALDYLKQALAVWEPADEAYQPAALARQRYQTLSAGNP